MSEEQHQEPILNELLERFQVDREWLNMVDHHKGGIPYAYKLAAEKGIDEEMLVVMLCWRCVETGDFISHGDGSFSINPKKDKK